MVLSLHSTEKPELKRKTGHFVTRADVRGSYEAYVPLPLPPDPPLEMDSELETLRDKANRALGRLDGIIDILPDTGLFIYQYVRKEALLSSQIEGTQSSMSDLFMFEFDETPGGPLDEVEEVSNYVAALNHGRKRLDEGFPLSLRLFREIHEILLWKGRGGDRLIGEFRRGQNRIGGLGIRDALYVPPPADLLMECLGPFENFLHDNPIKMPILQKAALAHVQFESIHPFEDGNGRLGRLLITLLLYSEEVLKEPTLYLSLYFKNHRDEYYNRLQNVRVAGDWEGWLRFFYTGVLETSQQAVQTAHNFLNLFKEDFQKLQSLGRVSATAIRLHRILQESPIMSIPMASKKLGLSQQAVNKSMNRLEDLGIVREITNQRRNRIYLYQSFVDILAEGTEPL